MDYEKRKKLNNEFLNGPFSGRMISDVVKFLKEKDSKNLTGGEIKDIWKRYLYEYEGKDLRLSLYTNIPFCINKCSFCLYNSKKLEESDNILQYAENIVNHYRYFSDIFRNRIFSSFYFGGGTPNILGVTEMEKILYALRENYNFKEEGEKTFEGNPILASEQKMKVLVKYGINRVSFGVQSFDHETLEKNNRGFQHDYFIQRAVDLTKGAGIKHINLDLIIGFNNDTKESVIRGFERIIKMGATSICIYPLRASNAYLDDFWGGNESRFIDSKTRLVNETMSSIVEIGDRYGYEFPLLGQTFSDLGDGTGFIFKKRDVDDFNGSDQFCTDDFNGISSILGVGQFASSKIHGNKVVYTNEKGISSDPEGDLFLVNQLSKEEMAADDFAKRFVSFNSMDINDIIQRTGVDLSHCFSEEVQTLSENSRIAVKEGKIVFIDNNLKNRENDLLFFIKEDKIMGSLAEYGNREKNHEESKKANMDNLPDKKEYPNQEEIGLKINTICDKVPSVVVDGYLVGLDRNVLKMTTVDGENKEFDLDKNFMIVKQAVIRSAGEEEILWKEIDKDLLTDNMKLSLIVSKEGDNVLLIKKLEIFGE